MRPTPPPLLFFSNKKASIRNPGRRRSIGGATHSPKKRTSAVRRRRSQGGRGKGGLSSNDATEAYLTPSRGEKEKRGQAGPPPPMRIRHTQQGVDRLRAVATSSSYPSPLSPMPHALDSMAFHTHIWCACMCVYVRLVWWCCGEIAAVDEIVTFAAN